MNRFRHLFALVLAAAMILGAVNAQDSNADNNESSTLGRSMQKLSIQNEIIGVYLIEKNYGKLIEAINEIDKLKVPAADRNHPEYRFAAGSVIARCTEAMVIFCQDESQSETERKKVEKYALKLIDQGLKNYKENKGLMSSLFFQRGRLLTSQGKFADAVTSYRKAREALDAQ